MGIAAAMAYPGRSTATSCLSSVFSAADTEFTIRVRDAGPLVAQVEVDRGRRLELSLPRVLNAVRRVCAEDSTVWLSIA
jgi:hypothetical protein